MRKLILPAVLLALLAASRASAQCDPKSLAIVVNKGNGTESLSPAQLRKIVLGDVRVWPDKKRIVLVARDANTKTFQCVLSNVVRLSLAEYKRYIMNAEFRGDEPVAIHTADSDSTAVRMIAGTDGSIAVIDAASVASLAGSVKVMRVNGKAPGDPGYDL